MANETINENASNEKSLHERVLSANEMLERSKSEIRKICKEMLKLKKNKEFILQVNALIDKLDTVQLQLNYYDDTLKEQKIQEVKPYTTKPEDKE
jgi:uncharacterized protein YacL (UPF0231 family)